jgi:enoyl-CoA hydratase
VLACDLVVASRAASFGLPEVTRGLVATAGGMIRLPRVVPMPVALELALTGRPISAERAFQVGMVNVLCEPGEARARAIELSGHVVANAPIAVQLSRRVMLASASVDEEEGWRLSREAYREVARTEDFREGPRAFVEKRAPVWQGR